MSTVLYAALVGMFPNVVVLSDLGVGISASTVSAASSLVPQASDLPNNAQSAYVFAVKHKAVGGLGNATATAYLMTSYDGGTTWVVAAQSTVIDPGQDLFETIPCVALGPLVGVAWQLTGAPAPTVTGKAWLISNDVFRADPSLAVVLATYATPASSTTPATTADLTLAIEELTWKAPVRLATTIALPAYTRVDNVITANVNGALPTIDGVAPVVGDRLVLKNGASNIDNGIYTVTSLGSLATKWSLTRATDFDTSAKVVNNAATLVDEGTLNANRMMRITTPNPIDLNTTPLVWSSTIDVPLPTTDLEAANKEYVDSSIYKTSVRVATFAALPAYTRVANTITENVNGALPAIDGVVLVAGDRLLLKNGAASADNGIYVVSQVGTAGTPFILDRAEDMDKDNDVGPMMLAPIAEGTQGAGAVYACTAVSPITLNVTSLLFLKAAGYKTNLTETAAPIAVGDDDEIVIVDTTAGDVVISLPAIATRRSRPFTVANRAAANNAIVTPVGGDTVGGAATNSVGPHTGRRYVAPRTGTDYVILG